ncbi:MAG: hypothetical protein AAF499_14150 [Pseudomonadota bacterium]
MKHGPNVGADIDLGAYIRLQQTSSRAVTYQVLALVLSSLAALAIYTTHHLHAFGLLYLNGWDSSLGVFAWLAAGYLIFRGSQLRRTAHHIADTPTTSIAHAAQGITSLHGIARPLNGQTFRPFRGMPECVWFDVSVTQARTRRGGVLRFPAKSLLWSAPKMPAGFNLEDNTGLCGVRTESARVHCLNADVWRKQIGDRDYTVQYLRDGAPVYVIGAFSSHRPDTGPDARHANWLQALRDLKRDRPSLLARFDSNQDQDIDEDEWRAAQRVVRSEVDAAMHAQSLEPPKHWIRAAPGLDLVISNRQPDIAASHHTTLSRWYTAAGLLHIVGGGMMML